MKGMSHEKSMGTNALPGLHRCPLFNDLYPTIYIQRSNEMPRDLMYPQGEYLGVFRRRFGAQSAATIALNSPAWD